MQRPSGFTPGAPSVEQARALTFNVEAQKTAPYWWPNASDARHAAGQDSNDFPTVPFPKMPEDTNMAIKRSIAEDGRVVQVMPITDEDVSYIKKKRDLEEQTAFDTWIGQKFDLTDPAQQKLLREINPEYYGRREDLIKSQIDLAGRYAKSRLFGAQSYQDLVTEWGVETKRIQLPTGPVWDPYMWYQSQQRARDPNQTVQDMYQDANIYALNFSKYTEGLFSPIKVINIFNRGWQANPNNRSDIMGREDRPMNTAGANASRQGDWRYDPYAFMLRDNYAMTDPRRSDVFGGTLPAGVQASQAGYDANKNYYSA